MSENRKPDAGNRPQQPTMYARVEAAAQAIRRRCGAPPQTAVVLGSGLGGLVEALHDRIEVPYAELPHWPGPGVAGHPGRLAIGGIAGRRVAALAGRVHLYEGYDAGTVAFATRVMGRLGVEELILTSAAGGIGRALRPGTLMIVDDHVNLTGRSPLAGPNDERWGPRFPDMSIVYSERLRAVADRAARDAGIAVAHGVYAAMAGPAYETPAEVRFLRTIGADAVGMSLVPEAIAARHMGIDVLGIACVTNAAAGTLPQPLTHAEVLERAARLSGALTALLERVIALLAQEQRRNGEH